MKIVCENCGAKYSIADEKIKGKVFKIRCKKCNESIVIRGDAQAAMGGREEPAISLPPQTAVAEAGGEDGEVETRVFDYSGYRDGGPNEPVWHIVIDGNQQGPYTTAQIREYLAAGSLDNEMFIWREGFADWKAIRDIPDFKPGGAPQKAAAPRQQAPAGGLFDAPAAGGGLFDAPAASAGLFDAKPAGGLFGGGGKTAGFGDVFSSAPAQETPASGGGLFGGTASSGGGGGLFGGSSGGGGGLFDGSDGAGDLFGDSSEGEGGGIFSSTASPKEGFGPRVSAQQAMMTGQRNENSVLFSLSNLQALARSNEASAPKAAGGGAGEEASGLIDIRSMASAMSSSDKSGLDDLISIGGGGFAPSLGAPVLAAQHVGMSTGAKIGIAAGGAVVVAALVVAAILLLKDEEKPSQDPMIAELKAQIAAMQAKGGGDSKEMAALTDRLKAEEKRVEESATAPSSPSSSDGATSKAASSEGKKSEGKRSHEGKRSSDKGSSDKAPAASKEKDDDLAGGGSSSGGSSSGGGGKKVDELDDLLGKAAGGGGGGKKPKAEEPKETSGGGGGGGGGDSLPDKLSRDQVQSGMNSVSGSVKKCGQGQTGTVTVQAMIAPTGRVTSATTTGSFAGTPAGLCAARAVRGARFPATKNSLTVTYPFKF